MKDKYKAVVKLRTKDGEEVILRFHSLTLAQAKAFEKLFDQFDHVFSTSQLRLHMWEKVE
jgi:hypothetical protein